MQLLPSPKGDGRAQFPLLPVQFDVHEFLPVNPSAPGIQCFRPAITYPSPQFYTFFFRYAGYTKNSPMSSRGHSNNYLPIQHQQYIVRPEHSLEHPFGHCPAHKTPDCASPSHKEYYSSPN